MPALTIVTFTVIGNNVIVGESPKGIVSEAAYVALIPAVIQARNNFIDFMAA
jgi:hypothetical protein